MNPLNNDDDAHQDIIQNLLKTPLEIEDCVPLRREELYERNQNSLADTSLEVTVKLEEKLDQPDIMNDLSNNPISVEGVLKLTRDKLHDRTL